MLEIRLSDSSYAIENLENLEEKVNEENSGRRVVGAHLAYNAMPRAVAPLSEGNQIIFTAAPSTGTDLF